MHVYVFKGLPLPPSLAEILAEITAAFLALIVSCFSFGDKYFLHAGTF